MYVNGIQTDYTVEIDKVNDYKVIVTLVPKMKLTKDSVVVYIGETIYEMNYNEENRTIVQDLISPNIEFTSPTLPSNTIQNVSFILVNVSISTEDSPTEDCMLQLDNINYTMLQYNGWCYKNITVSHGQHSYIVYVNDSAGNINQTETRT